MPQADIIMYGTTWCPDCARAKRFLEARGVPYEWTNIDSFRKAQSWSSGLIGASA